MSNFLETLRGYVFQGLTEIKFSVWLSVALLVLFGALLLVGAKKNRFTVRTLAYAALCLAISFVLSYVKVFDMPQGGSITVCSMLPIVAFSLYAGLWQGAVVGLAYGLLQVLQGAYIVNPIQGALDYFLAFAAMSLGALANKLPVSERWKIPLALLIGSVARWAIHTLAGVVFFADYAGEENVFIYSAVYNAFLFPEAALSALVSFIPGFTRVFAPLKKAAA